MPKQFDAPERHSSLVEAMNSHIISRFSTLLNTSSDIKEHLPILAIVGKGKRVVEFGFRDGKSSTAFLAGGCETLISYDIEDCSSAVNLIKCDSFTFIKSDSTKVSIPVCDVLFIDSLHEGNHLSKELNMHCDKVKEMIIMHDTWCNKFPDMHSSVDAFLNNHHEWKIFMDLKNCNGLTILERVK